MNLLWAAGGPMWFTYPPSRRVCLSPGDAQRQPTCTMTLLSLLIAGTLTIVVVLGAFTIPAFRELCLDLIFLGLAAAVLAGVFRCIIGAMDRAQERRWFNNRNPNFDENNTNQRKDQ